MNVSRRDEISREKNRQAGRSLHVARFADTPFAIIARRCTSLQVIARHCTSLQVVAGRCISLQAVAILCIAPASFAQTHAHAYLGMKLGWPE
jgi:hypothetical protein